MNTDNITGYGIRVAYGDSDRKRVIRNIMSKLRVDGYNPILEGKHSDHAQIIGVVACRGKPVVEGLDLGDCVVRVITYTYTILGLGADYDGDTRPAFQRDWGHFSVDAEL